MCAKPNVELVTYLHILRREKENRFFDRRREEIIEVIKKITVCACALKDTMRKMEDRTSTLQYLL